MATTAIIIVIGILFIYYLILFYVFCGLVWKNNVQYKDWILTVIEMTDKTRAIKI